MQGAIEALLTGIITRGLGPALFTVLMAAPGRKVARAQLKKIYVLDEHGEMTGEYILDPDCPIDYNDFLKTLPPDGIGDRDSLFVGEYVFTAFQSGKFVFVLLSRGHLAAEDVDWTALLLRAADSHLAHATSRSTPGRPSEPKADDKASSGREAKLLAKEKTLAEQEARLKADSANLAGRQEELNRQKEKLAELADYASRMQDTVASGVSRAMKTLEVAEQLNATQNVDPRKADSSAATDARQAFEEERKALLAQKDELEAKHREMSERIAQLENDTREAVSTLEKERSEVAARTADEEKTRREIETRVADLSQRFAAMAKERLVASHRPPTEPSDDVRKGMEGEKAELARERKFLQRRAIELLDREERVRDRETKGDERDRELVRRAGELTTREEDVERERTLIAQARPQALEVRPGTDDAQRDLDRRVKIIQQKALELLDREEKLRRRAAELEAMEARLSRGVTAE